MVMLPVAVEEHTGTHTLAARIRMPSMMNGTAAALLIALRACRCTEGGATELWYKDCYTARQRRRTRVGVMGTMVCIA